MLRDVSAVIWPHICLFVGEIASVPRRSGFSALHVAVISRFSTWDSVV